MTSKRLNNVTAQELFDSRLAMPKQVRDAMIASFPVYAWESKNKRIVSSDRKSDAGVMTKRLTKTTNFSRVGGSELFTYIKSTSKRVELQEYKVTQSVDNDAQEHFDFELVNLARFTDDGIAKASMRWECEDGKYDRRPVKRPVKGLTTPHMFTKSFSSKVINGSKHVSVKADEALANGPFKYIDFSYLQLSESYDFLDLLERLYKLRDKVEYLQKIANNDAGAESVDFLVTSPRLKLRDVTWKKLKAVKGLIKQGYSLKALHYQKDLEKSLTGITLTKDFACKYAGNSNWHWTLAQIFERTHQVKVGYVKLQNYFCKNDIDPSKYYSFLQKLNKLCIPLTKSLALPKDFEQLMQELRVQEETYYDRQFAKAEKPKAVMFNATYDGLLFYVPVTRKELVKESVALHNCLSSYDDRLMENKTTVIFVRDANKPDVPYCAMEISNKNQLVQLRTKYNKLADKNVQKIVKNYIKDVYIPKKTESLSAVVA